MASAGLLETQTVDIDRPWPRAQPDHAPPELSPAQAEVAAKLVSAVRDGSAKPFLLDGVTGSGKTETYSEAIAEALRTDRQVLVLLPEIALTADHVVIDGPPRVAGLMRSALLAADLVLIPVQPSPFDGWASAEMLGLLREARIYRPQLAARFVLNRCGARTVIARETAETLADHDPPVLSSTVGQRVVFADAAQSGRLVFELAEQSAAAREIAALAAEVARIAP